MLRRTPSTTRTDTLVPDTTRFRAPPRDARGAALEAARALLLESGPQAFTLKAFAARIGRTHAHLLHHFGSAAGLQKALIERMAGAITSTIREAALRARAVDQNPREVVDLTFDAFDRSEERRGGKEWVSVDSGGRRIHKKNNKQNQTKPKSE